MAEPLIEHIVNRFARTIRETLRNAPAAGFNTTLQRVFRALVLPGECDEYPYACVLTGDQTGEYRTHNFIRESFEVQVYVFVVEADLERVDTVANRAVADIKKAVGQDDFLRGGQTSTSAGGIDGALVDKTHYIGTTAYPIAADAPNIEARLVVFQTEYLHQYNDPYTGRS